MSARLGHYNAQKQSADFLSSSHSWRRHPRPRLWWWTRFPGLRHQTGHCQVHRTLNRLASLCLWSQDRCNNTATYTPSIHETAQTGTAAWESRFTNQCKSPKKETIAPLTHVSPHRSPTTKSTLMSTPRTSSSRPSLPTTAHSLSPITAGWNPRSSVVKVPVPGTRSLTVKQFATSTTIRSFIMLHPRLLYFASLLESTTEIGLLSLCLFDG